MARKDLERALPEEPLPPYPERVGPEIMKWIRDLYQYLSRLNTRIKRDIIDPPGEPDVVELGVNLDSGGMALEGFNEIGLELGDEGEWTRIEGWTVALEPWIVQVDLAQGSLYSGRPGVYSVVVDLGVVVPAGSVGEEFEVRVIVDEEDEFTHLRPLRTIFNHRDSSNPVVHVGLSGLLRLEECSEVSVWVRCNTEDDRELTVKSGSFTLTRLRDVSPESSPDHQECIEVCSECNPWDVPVNKLAIYIGHATVTGGDTDDPPDGNSLFEGGHRCEWDTASCGAGFHRQRSHILLHEAVLGFDRCEDGDPVFFGRGFRGAHVDENFNCTGGLVMGSVHPENVLISDIEIKWNCSENKWQTRTGPVGADFSEVPWEDFSNRFFPTQTARGIKAAGAVPCYEYEPGKSATGSNKNLLVDEDEEEWSILVIGDD